MITKSVMNPGWFEITDEAANNLHYGCDQNWYPHKWQRQAGCGPSAASNIFHYLTHSLPPPDGEQIRNSKASLVALMAEMWNYVTPGLLGVHTTRKFSQGFLAFARVKGIDIAHASFNVPKSKAARAKLSDLLLFLEEGLSADAPIAFLNFQNGEEKSLDSWHWVTIISIAYTEDGKTIFADILDEGVTKRIDLGLWYNTTTLGGGFVYFACHTPPDKHI